MYFVQRYCEKSRTYNGCNQDEALERDPFIICRGVHDVMLGYGALYCVAFPIQCAIDKSPAVNRRPDVALSAYANSIRTLRKYM
jgi:hypothetical protein